MANPPFNISDWVGEQLQDSHLWKYGSTAYPTFLQYTESKTRIFLCYFQRQK